MSTYRKQGYHWSSRNCPTSSGVRPPRDVVDQPSIRKACDDFFRRRGLSAPPPESWFDVKKGRGEE